MKLEEKNIEILENEVGPIFLEVGDCSNPKMTRYKVSPSSASPTKDSIFNHEVRSDEGMLDTTIKAIFFFLREITNLIEGNQ